MGGLSLPDELYYRVSLTTTLRFTKDGILDKNFDDEGIAIADLREGKVEIALCTTILSDRKTLVGGFVFEQWYRSDFSFLRFLTNKEDIDTEEEEGMDSIEIVVPREETFLFPNPVIDRATQVYVTRMGTCCFIQTVQNSSIPAARP